MNISTTSDLSSSAGLRDIHRLISECHVVLEKDPSCLHTRAVRGHACMKAKLWDQAIRDFSEILRCRPDDVHGRFSRGMALFKSGRVDDAHRDFSRVLELNPNHVMARYARAGCFNSEGEFNQAIQEYTLALQHDEKENAGGFRPEKRRMGLHEIAEHLIRKTMGASARLRTASLDIEPSPFTESRLSLSVLEGAGIRSPLTCLPGQEPSVQLSQNVSPRSESVPGKRPKKVVQVRVNLSEFASVASQLKGDPYVPPAASQILRKEATVPPHTNPEAPSGSRSSIDNQLQQAQVPQVLAVRAVPKTVRRVTVAL